MLYIFISLLIIFFSSAADRQNNNNNQVPHKVVMTGSFMNFKAIPVSEFEAAIVAAKKDDKTARKFVKKNK